MRSSLLLLVLFGVVVLGWGGCASRTQSENHIYAGDAPNIRYAPSSAGGPQSVY